MEIETDTEARFVACDGGGCLLAGRIVNGCGMTIMEMMVVSLTIWYGYEYLELR